MALGTISTANVTSLPTSAPIVMPALTTDAYVQMLGVGPGARSLVFSVGAGLVGTLGVYTSQDGRYLGKIPDTSIFRMDTGTYGPIASNTAATYSISSIPAGSVNIICSAFTSGSAGITLDHGDPLAAMPGTPFAGSSPACPVFVYPGGSNPPLNPPSNISTVDWTSTSTPTLPPRALGVFITIAGRLIWTDSGSTHTLNVAAGYFWFIGAAPTSISSTSTATIGLLYY